MGCCLHKHTLTILFILSLNAAIGQIAENLRFANINNLDGIPNNSVTDIIQDELGFIWLGTKDGLCRYEAPGLVKNYKVNDPEIDGGLESSNISRLYIDSKQNLWIGTRLGGLSKFDQSSDTWKTYRYDSDDNTSISNDEILAITEDSEGRLWVGTENGLNVYNYETEKFVRFRVNKSDSTALQAEAILSIVEDTHGQIWIGTWEGGISLMSPSKDGNIENSSFRTFFPSESIFTRRVWTITQCSQGYYWLGTANGGLIMMTLPPEASNDVDKQNWHPKFHQLTKDGTNSLITHDDIKDIIEDRNHNLWVATSHGLNCLPASEVAKLKNINSKIEDVGLSLRQYYYDISDPHSLINNNVRSLYEDVQGIIWAGTFGGVSQYNWAIHQFTVPNLSSSITKNPISQNLYIDKEGKAWLANGELGIIKYDFENNKVLDRDCSYGTAEFVFSLYSPDDKNLYFSHSKGVNVLDLQSHKIKQYTIFAKSDQQGFSPRIRAMYVDHSNQIWVGTEEGLYVVNELSGEVTVHLKDLNNPETISDNTVNGIIEDSDGTIWLATFQGLNKVIQKEDGSLEFIHYRHDIKNSESSIPSNRIYSIVEHNKVLYIGSDNGLSSIDLVSNTYQNYSAHSDKHSYQSILVSEDGNIWGSTKEGIVVYNTALNSFNQYDRTDGIGNIEFCQGCRFRDKDGQLFFSGHGGALRVEPTNLIQNTDPPEVHITDIKTLNSKGERTQTITYEEEVTLDHTTNYISIDYAVLNYNRPIKNQYSYKLEGFDDVWRHPTKKAPVVYTNLEHGTYNFKVRAANNDGFWTPEATSLTIIKKAAYWETLWFKVLSIIMGVLLISSGVRAYTRNIKQQNEALEKYNQDLNTEINVRRKVEQALNKQQNEIKLSNSKLEETINQLAQSNRDLEQFAYIASHDLQEPLRMVNNFVGLLKHRYGSQLDQDAHEYIEFIRNGVNRMSKQIKSILTFSRIHQKDLELKDADMNQIISTALKSLALLIEEKNVDIHVGRMPRVQCNNILIGMVFYNLINNGIKFNEKERPQINISYDAIYSDEFWKFSVTDNGIGIDESHHSKIFELLNRLHNKSTYEGTGIGLALCKKIIYHHGGDIWIESQVGEGSTFHFTIRKNPTLQLSARG